MRRVRICYFNQWAGRLEPVEALLPRVPGMDLRPLVSDPRDRDLLRKARLDCDWYAANARCFAAMKHDEIEFLPTWVVGLKSVLDLAAVPREAGEEHWLITMGQQPQLLGEVAGKVFAFLAKSGVRHLYYAFDEASRYMPCFNDLAPHLAILIHDEAPLAEAGQALLRPGCLVQHRSWVANFAPGEARFNEAPEERIIFLGSQLGLTPHRQRQIEFLKRRFKDRFVALHDHTTPVDGRVELNRHKVSFCPEGRKFGTPAMSASHTDRPFWSGCLGMVPVSENSQAGGRLEELHAAGLIVRYDHGDLVSLAAACERALAMTAVERRRIYEHFNAHETVGAVVAAAIAAA
jgi:hypothetical protein